MGRCILGPDPHPQRVILSERARFATPTQHIRPGRLQVARRAFRTPAGRHTGVCRPRVLAGDIRLFGLAFPMDARGHPPCGRWYPLGGLTKNVAQGGREAGDPPGNRNFIAHRVQPIQVRTTWESREPPGASAAGECDSPNSSRDRDFARFQLEDRASRLGSGGICGPLRAFLWVILLTEDRRPGYYRLRDGRSRRRLACRCGDGGNREFRVRGPRTEGSVWPRIKPWRANGLYSAAASWAAPPMFGGETVGSVAVCDSAREPGSSWSFGAGVRFVTSGCFACMRT